MRLGLRAAHSGPPPFLSTHIASIHNPLAAHTLTHRCGRQRQLWRIRAGSRSQRCDDRLLASRVPFSQRRFVRSCLGAWGLTVVKPRTKGHLVCQCGVQLGTGPRQPVGRHGFERRRAGGPSQLRLGGPALAMLTRSAAE